MAVSNAWILDFGSNLKAAVSVQELQHLVDGPNLLHDSLLPSYCQNSFDWQGENLTVFNLADWMDEKQDFPSVLQRPLVCVLAYQNKPGGSLKHGALTLASIPNRIQVNDNQACALPAQLSPWKDIAISCFMLEKTEIPIIDLPVLFEVMTGNHSIDTTGERNLSSGVSGF